MVLVVARALGLERLGEASNIKRSIICFKMRYFICNIFYVSGPTMSQSAVPMGGASSCILGQVKEGVRLLKALLLQCGQVLGLRLSGVVPFVAMSLFRPNLLVRFVTSATSLEFEATNASLLIVSAAIAAVSCSSTNFSVVTVAERFSK